MTYLIPQEEYGQIVKETQDAIKKGLDHATAEWRQMALEILYKACVAMKELTVNDFRERVDASPWKTYDKRAMGGIMATGKKLGWIEKTGESIASRVGHLSRLQIWKSLVHEKNSLANPQQQLL